MADRDPTQLAARLAEADPAFAPVIEAAGPYDPRAAIGDPFTALLRAIVFQQLAGKAAMAIYNRVGNLFAEHPNPEELLKLSPEQLRAAGLSTAKTSAVIDLATHFHHGNLDTDWNQLTDDEIIARATTVRGIGRWTAEMFLLFELRRLDVWPVDDLGVRKGFQIVHKLPSLPQPKELLPQGERYRPYRSVAAWYCWRAVDTVT